MKTNIILVILIAILCFCLFKTCNRKPEYITKYKIDTLLVQKEKLVTKLDTFRSVIYKPKHIIYHDTLKIDSVIYFAQKCDTLVTVLQRIDTLRLRQIDTLKTKPRKSFIRGFGIGFGVGFIAGSVL
jgi:hypothetical protein